MLQLFKKLQIYSVFLIIINHELLTLHLNYFGGQDLIFVLLFISILKIFKKDKFKSPEEAKSQSTDAERETDQVGKQHEEINKYGPTTCAFKMTTLHSFNI